jgi:hypothetical protein
MSRTKRVLTFAPLAILAILLFAFIGGQIVRLLWNWLLPPLFGFPPITFWQALGLLALSRILFGGFGGRGSRGSGVGRRASERMSDRIADRLAERWERMTPEERERFRQGTRERWGFDASADSRGD